MSYALYVAPSAERDIEDAANYIERVLLNPQAADELLADVETALLSLREDPQRVKRVSDPLLKAWGIRLMPVRNYMAFFVIDEERRRVEIVRFLYARRNWPRILRGEC